MQHLAELLDGHAGLDRACTHPCRRTCRRPPPGPAWPAGDRRAPPARPGWPRVCGCSLGTWVLQVDQDCSRRSAARNHPPGPSGVTRSDYLAPSRLMFVHCTNMRIARPLTAAPPGCESAQRPGALRSVAAGGGNPRPSRPLGGPDTGPGQGEGMSQTTMGRHLGGLTAAVLAGALLAVAPLGLAGPRRRHGRWHRRRAPGPAGDGRQGGRGPDPEPRAGAEDRQARRVRGPEDPHQRGPQLRAVRAHLPRPARRRRRLRRGDRRRGPRPQHLGRADQQGPARVDHPARAQGQGHRPWPASRSTR